MVSQPVRTSARSFAAAFTLIELLTVVAIIGILAAITLGVTRGVNERAAINQTRAELSALATALESYKRAYGDYPWVGSASAADGNRQALYAALNGFRGPRGNPLNPQGKRFIDITQFTVLDSTGAPATNLDAPGNYLADPWGRQYNYYYKVSPGTDWTAPSFVLYSFGPTIGSSATATVEPDNARPNSLGIVSLNHSSNLDNIYANSP